uniref:LO5 n=1 Tax=Grenadier adomavirus TaxID=2609868 RepID=A0A6F9EZE5_9VIRU|nr:TPA_asm: LO5 [Grenadier adomavirus]
MNQWPQWVDYSTIRPGEVGRDVFLVFDDNAGRNLCEARFNHPFLLMQQSDGRRNVGLGCCQMTVFNTAKNISAANGTSVIRVGNVPLTLRDGHYETQDQIETEINTQLQKKGGIGDIQFETDHLGYVTLRGTNPLAIPLLHDGKYIPDHIGDKLGFHTPTSEDPVEIDGEPYMVIQPGSQAVSCGDLFGPVGECLLICDECIYTPETQRVITTAALASYPARSQICCHPELRYRPLHDAPTLHKLTLRLVDRVSRSLNFVSGTPSATIDIKCL